MRNMVTNIVIAGLGGSGGVLIEPLRIDENRLRNKK
jgi:Pyruvate/2-oxoacid:ferredoxin oxidoreductase gamma subunit